MLAAIAAIQPRFRYDLHISLPCFRQIPRIFANLLRLSLQAAYAIVFFHRHALYFAYFAEMYAKCCLLDNPATTLRCISSLALCHSILRGEDNLRRKFPAYFATFVWRISCLPVVAFLPYRAKFCGFCETSPLNARFFALVSAV